LFLLFLAPVTRFLENQIHQVIHWLSPVDASPRIVLFTYPDDLTDLEKKVRLSKALVAMETEPPAALVIAGDWSHNTPSWVNAENQNRPLDSVLESQLNAISQKTLLTAPLYSKNEGMTRHLSLLSTPAEIELLDPDNSLLSDILQSIDPIPKLNKLNPIILGNWQELLAFSAPLAAIDSGQLILRHEDKYLQSLPFALYQNVSKESQPDSLQAQLKNWSLEINPGAMTISPDGVIWSRLNNSHISTDSLALLDSQAANLWKNKTVFIAPDSDLLLASNVILLTALETKAWDWRPGWDSLIFWLLLMSLVAYLWLLLPKLSKSVTTLILSLLVTIILVTQVILAISHHWWLSGVYLASWLVTMHLGLWVFQHLSNLALSSQRSKDEAYQMLAVGSQEKGEYAATFGYLKRCSGTTYTRDLLYQLGQQLEKKREYKLAIKVYRHLLTLGDKQHEKLHSRIDRLQQAASVVAGEIRVDHAQTMLLPETGLERPQLGRYQIDTVIGQGAMGVVYLGSDPKIGRSVAIKTLALSSEFAGHDLDEAKQRFYREAETAGQLRHPNIVTIYDVGEEQDLAYIAMDYLQGRPLSDFIKPENLLPVGKVFNLMQQVAEALSYAHSQKIVHRDIKPANMIYYAENEQVVVTDFGIACVTDNSKTRTGTILGSPYYMSPEQLAGARVDGRADIFSLGVTMYQLLTGSLPFEGDNLASLTYSIANQKHIPIRKQRPDLPGNVTRLVNKALSKRPAQRFQDAAEFAQEIEKALSRIS
jgi:tRNA A-37 threonylcarbamoyl transferase component Bud32